MSRPRSEARALRAAFAGGPLAFARRVAKEPFVLAAAHRIGTRPTCELADLVAAATYPVTLAPRTGRHAWSLGAAEQMVIELLIADRGMGTAFEIGTFNGGTTAVIAEALPADGKVITLDLPEDQFTATQGPTAFTAADVGAMHRASPAASKVTQLRHDSLRFDPTPWESWADLVLVDGAHDYEHGFVDTKTALRLVKPGGIVLWDDFDPYWHGLIHGVLDAAEGLDTAKLVGTSLLVLDRVVK